MNIKDIYSKYKDVIPYLFFGVCTTIVNVLVYTLFARVLSTSVMISTIVAWNAAVVFAYITNRKWVFYSKAESKKDILKEIVSFFSCRLATGIIDWGCMFIFVDLLKCNDIIIKFVSNIFVIILNYVASKLIIFKKKQYKGYEG